MVSYRTVAVTSSSESLLLRKLFAKSSMRSQPEASQALEKQFEPSRLPTTNSYCLILTLSTYLMTVSVLTQPPPYHDLWQASTFYQ